MGNLYISLVVNTQSGRYFKLPVSLKGEPLSSGEAVAAGLVAKTFSRETILEETLHTAQRLAKLPKVGRVPN
jgi:enoyl-CoA hydratase/carnithine racemase